MEYENKIYDIAVIGLGPAGSTLARLLPDNFKVVAIDKKSASENSFRKPCGGLLAPDAQKILSYFGLTLPNTILADPQIFSVRTIDITKKLVRHYQRFYLNMDRHKFDLWLRSLIPKHIEILDNTVCTKIENFEQFYHLTCHSNGETKKIVAKYIVGADGANSIVRRTIYPKLTMKTYLAIQQCFINNETKPFYSSIFDHRITDCYAWGLSKDNYFILGGAFQKKHAQIKFEDLKQKMKQFDFNLENPIRTEACLVLRPTLFSSFACASNNAFLIGEAAGFISPSSLEGISYAMKSALILSNVLKAKKKRPESEYKKATRKIRIKLRMKLFKVPFMYSPLLRAFIMKSKIGSIDII